MIEKSTSGKLEFDEIDQAIVRLLRTNGRANNQELAKLLGIKAKAISGRIRRMEKANKLRVVAVSDFAAHGYNILIPLMIEVNGRPATEVAEQLVELPEVFAVHLVTGPYDIDVLLALKDYEEVSALMQGKLSKIEGIRSITPAIVVDVVKYAFDVAPTEDLGSVA